MIEIVAFSILFQEAQAAGVRALCGIDDIVWLVEVNLVIIAYYLTLRLGLQAHLDDVT